MLEPTPRMLVIHGLFPAKTPPRACPICGAAEAHAPAANAAGFAVYGLACTWGLFTGVLRCTTALDPETALEAIQHFVRTRTRRLKPVSDSAFGDAIITRSEFADGLTPEGLADLWEAGRE